jgi:hypothetical protein
VATIAYHFHWPYDQVMRLEHRERLQWVAEIAKINAPDRGWEPMTTVAPAAFSVAANLPGHPPRPYMGYNW